MNTAPDPDRQLDAQLHLLDRQVLDRDGVPVTAVDDLELSDIPFGRPIPPGTPAPVITNLLCGAALAPRIFGGHPPPSVLARIPWEDVAKVDIVLRLRILRESLDALWVERWVRDRIIARIPGGRHDPQ